MVSCNGGMHKNPGLKIETLPDLTPCVREGIIKHKDRALPANGRPLLVKLQK